MNLAITFVKGLAVFAIARNPESNISNRWTEMKVTFPHPRELRGCFPAAPTYYLLGKNNLCGNFLPLLRQQHLCTICASSLSLFYILESLQNFNVTIEPTDSLVLFDKIGHLSERAST